MNDHHGLTRLQRHIYLESKQGREPPAVIMPWVTDRHNLQAAWLRVAGSDGARTPGPNGLTVRDFANRRDVLLRQLTTQLMKGTFRPSPARIVEVPKSSGAGTRKLGVLNVQDRIVHAALKQVLEPIVEPGFSNHSFGFRPGRSVPFALVTATRLLSRSRQSNVAYTHIAKMDVESCFDTLDHAVMLNQLHRVTTDHDVLRLVERILCQSGSIKGWPWRRRMSGVIQGSGLSPLLCNLYLDQLDQEFEHLNGAKLLRYADDLLVIAQSMAAARKAVARAEKKLARSHQRIKRSKCAIGPATQGVAWLGVEIGPRTKSAVDGEFAYFVPSPKLQRMQERIAEMTVPPNARIDPAAFDLAKWLQSINEQLRDWWSVYMYAANAQETFRQLDQFTFERVGELLYAITGQRRRALLEQYRVKLPRGFTSWQIDGTRLTVLSSLAPRNPDRLCFPPAWMRRPRPYRFDRETAR